MSRYDREDGAAAHRLRELRQRHACKGSEIPVRKRVRAAARQGCGFVWADCSRREYRVAF